MSRGGPTARQNVLLRFVCRPAACPLPRSRLLSCACRVVCVALFVDCRAATPRDNRPIRPAILRLDPLLANAIRAVWPRRQHLGQLLLRLSWLIADSCLTRIHPYCPCTITTWDPGQTTQPKILHILALYTPAWWPPKDGVQLGCVRRFNPPCRPVEQLTSLCIACALSVSAAA